MSACATCDGFFFRGKKVIVVGGGNTAVEEALYLANIASHVTLVHRRGALRAEKILQERLFANPKIEVMWNAELARGARHRRSALRHRRAALKNTLTGEIVTRPVDGIFIAIGHEPQTELFKGQLEMKPSGYIVTDAALDRDERARRLRGRRRRRRHLPAGGDRRGLRLHGGARRREISRRHRAGRSRRRIGALLGPLPTRLALERTTVSLCRS